ncbi:MAG: rhomboid family intramembrane serine protease [Oscillospiraceae bacterium]|nr:rhomboid family intramembrane serine protease [Oscillospiraceae bacterium]
MLYIAVANVAIGLIDNFSSSPLSYALFFSRSLIFQGEFWRLLTFIFVPITGDFGILFFTIPGTSLFTTVLSAYFYYWVGSMLERQWGTARFNCFYLTGVILNIFFGLVVGFSSIHYVNLSMFFAFAVLFPDLQVLFMFILPIKVKWLAWIDAALFVWQIITYLRWGLWLYALLPVVAILNFFIFFWTEFTQALGYRKQRFQHQHSAQTINFKKATKSAYQEKGYLHKCAVCGKTDTDYPEMEFRYCSKCNGYYCYCSEHINNHEHIR